jgi:hypothetical protein
MISIWEAGLDERKPQYLRKDESCQILILGGNLTGLFAALFCLERGYRVIVAEEETLEKRALEIDFFDKVEGVYEWAYSTWYPWIISKYHLKCHFQRMQACYYHLDQTPTRHMPKQPVFHPIKFFRELALHIPVYENVVVEEIKEHRLVTTRAYIDYEYLIDVRQKETVQKEIWTALEGIHLKNGIYLCMDGDASFLMWKEKLIVRDSYQFLFPKGIPVYQWEIDAGCSQPVYQSIARARNEINEILR